MQNSYATQRLTSIDALRGFDMFWILGGDFLFRSFRQIYDCPVSRELESQMEHVPYEGFHFYDFIFPLFLFIVGISITLALPRVIEKSGKNPAVFRITKRAVILFLLGIFYMGGISGGIDNIYLAGVLQRISVAYFFAALAFCYLNNRGLILLTAVLLIGYYAILALVPVPGFGEPSFEQGKNLAHYIDQRLPGQKFEGTILSTFGAVGNVLIGVLIGNILKIKSYSEQRKVSVLLITGSVILLTGFIWGIWFPVIKAIWTSSYVLVACGFGILLFALFYQVIEIWKYRKWAQPFIWIGMNSIAIYIAASILNFPKLAQRLIGGEVGSWLSGYHQLVTALISLIFLFWLARFLYRNKIFIKV